MTTSAKDLLLSHLSQLSFLFLSLALMKQSRGTTNTFKFFEDHLCKQCSLNKQEAFHCAGSLNKQAHSFGTPVHQVNFRSTLLRF